MVRIITMFNWAAIGGLALLILAATILPAKGGDATGRGMGPAFYYLSVIALAVLVLLNLLPYNWSRYTACGLVLIPFFLLAADAGWKQVRDRLRYRQAETYFADPLQQSLAEAISDGDTAKTRTLLDRYDRKHIAGLTQLLRFSTTHASSMHYRPAERLICVRMLLDAGADIRQAEAGLPGALLFAPAAAGNAALLHLLLERGADPNVHHPEHRKPLLFEAITAVDHASETVAVLLAGGADPCTTAGDRGREVSALMYAADHLRWDLCLLLIHAGADAAFRNDDGSSLLSLMEAADRSSAAEEYPFRKDFEALKKILLR